MLGRCRHLYHTDTSDVLDDVLDIASSALRLHREHATVQLIHVSLMTVSSLRALYLGAFSKAVEGFKQRRDFRYDQIKLPDERHLEAESNLAIAYASQGSFELSFEHLQAAAVILDRIKALEALELHHPEDSPQSKCLSVPTIFSTLLLALRSGSVHLAAGNIDEAESLLQTALHLAGELGLEYWTTKWVVYIYQSTDHF